MFCDRSSLKLLPGGAKAPPFKLTCHHHVDMHRLVSCSAHVSGGQSTVHVSAAVFVLDDAALIGKRTEFPWKDETHWSKRSGG